MSKKVIEDYLQARRKMGELFDTEIWYNVVDNRKEKWTDYGEKYGSIGWDLLSEDDGFDYSIEICGTSRWEVDEYVLAVGRDCFGNKDMYLFSKDNYVEEQ